jgi:hypothetical protein
MNCGANRSQDGPVSGRCDQSSSREIWREFVQILNVVDDEVDCDIQHVQGHTLDKAGDSQCPAVHTHINGVDAGTDATRMPPNVVVGPWMNSQLGKRREPSKGGNKDAS